MTTPLVSVIIPAHNEELYIERSINSILLQTYQNFEIIVVDNLSTDKTCDIVQKLIEKDNRIKLYHCYQKGPAAVRNLAINHAKGEFIMNLDGDDESKPYRIEKLLELCKIEKLCIIGSNVEVVNKNGQCVSIMKFPENNVEIREKFSKFFNRLSIMPGTIMAHTEIFKKFPYNENFIYLEDWDFILRASDDKDIVFKNLDNYAYRYYLNSDSVSFNWKIRNKYNTLVLVNQILRSYNKKEFYSLSDLEIFVKQNILYFCLYNLFLFVKSIQHRRWINKQKKLLSIRETNE